MDSNNFYYRIYQKKSSSELNEIITDPTTGVDSKLTALKVLENRGEMTEALFAIKDEMDQIRNALLYNEISPNKYDTLWARVGANIIDNIILRLTAYVFVYFEISASAALALFVLFLSAIFPYLYSILLQGFTGQTIGKMATNIKIFDKNEKVQMSFKQAVLRDCVPLGATIALFFLSKSGLLMVDGNISFLSLILLIILALWSLLEIITLLFNKKRRALHDFIAGTVVLKIKEK